MKKYYIVKFGEVVSTAEFFGNFEEFADAKEKAFPKMSDGDMLVGFNLDVDPEYTDSYGYDTVNLELAEEDEKAILQRSDGTMEHVPEGVYFWSDDDLETFYLPNGEVWDGKIGMNFLENLSYEEGEALLLNCGYKQTDSAKDYDAPGCDYIEDNYFTLFGDEDNEVHTVSFVSLKNENHDPANDDGSMDYVVKSYWQDLSMTTFDKQVEELSETPETQPETSRVAMRNEIAPGSYSLLEIETNEMNYIYLVNDETDQAAAIDWDLSEEEVHELSEMSLEELVNHAKTEVIGTEEEPAELEWVDSESIFAGIVLRRKCLNSFIKEPEKEVKKCINTSDKPKAVKPKSTKPRCPKL